MEWNFSELRDGVVFILNHSNAPKRVRLLLREDTVALQEECMLNGKSRGHKSLLKQFSRNQKWPSFNQLAMCVDHLPDSVVAATAANESLGPTLNVNGSVSSRSSSSAAAASVLQAASIATLAELREVLLKRDFNSGLGISIKGGQEHSLPVLISRVFAGQPAAMSGKIFVGDAILKINGMSVEHCTHDEVVAFLKSSGETVRLGVKHFQPANSALHQQHTSNSNSNPITDGSNSSGGMLLQPTSSASGASGRRRNGSFVRIDRYSLRSNSNSRTTTSGSVKSGDTMSIVSMSDGAQWSDLLTLPLMYAYVTCYQPGTDTRRRNVFEVFALDGHSTGSIFVEKDAVFGDWLSALLNNVTLLNRQMICTRNRSTSKDHHIHYMGWFAHRCGLYKANEDSHVITTASPSTVPPPLCKWKPTFIALRGDKLLLFQVPPVKAGDWDRYSLCEKIYRSAVRVLEAKEHVDGRRHCFQLHCGGAKRVHYMSAESLNDVLVFEKAWLRVNLTCIRNLKKLHFRCSYEDEDSLFCLDFDDGFSLLDYATQKILWQFRFSQLHRSWDDSHNTLTLQFRSKNGVRVDAHTYDLKIDDLPVLLMAVNSFLSAKLFAMDPLFFDRDVEK